MTAFSYYIHTRTTWQWHYTAALLCAVQGTCREMFYKPYYVFAANWRPHYRKKVNGLTNFKTEQAGLVP